MLIPSDLSCIDYFSAVTLLKVPVYRVCEGIEKHFYAVKLFFPDIDDENDDNFS